MDALAGREQIMIWGQGGHRAHGGGFLVATGTTSNLGLGLGSGVREK